MNNGELTFAKSLEFFVEHPYNLPHNSIAKLARAEQHLLREENVRIRWFYDDCPDLTWTNEWGHREWIDNMVREGLLDCLILHYEEKDENGNWKLIDGLQGIVCEKWNRRIYEAEIVLKNKKDEKK